jgi:hypothetical protein
MRANSLRSKCLSVSCPIDSTANVCYWLVYLLFLTRHPTANPAAIGSPMASRAPPSAVIRWTARKMNPPAADKMQHYYSGFLSAVFHAPRLSHPTPSAEVVRATYQSARIRWSCALGSHLLSLKPCVGATIFQFIWMPARGAAPVSLPLLARTFFPARL